jgi:predicted acetyltransferase
MDQGVSLRPAQAGEREVLENLGQLYAHDWSEMTPFDVGGDGRFEALSIDPYFLDDWRHPFLVRVDDKLAGFALIAAKSRLTGQAGVFDMAEFFILRALRRRGVGHAAAVLAFDRFRGSWEVRQRDENPAATTFWRRVIARYTRGRYEEVRWEKGLVQKFESRPLRDG